MSKICLLQKKGSPKGEKFAIIFPKPLDNFHIILYNKDKEKKL